MAINTELLEKIKLHILEEPRRYSQITVGRRSSSAPCGTAGCLYGWGGVLTGEIEDAAELADIGLCFPPSFFIRMNQHFGFTYEEGQIVSHRRGRDWPEPFGSRLRDAQETCDQLAEAQAAADYLDWIISTGKVTD